MSGQDEELPHGGSSIAVGKEKMEAAGHYLAQFTGTFVVVFTVGCNVLAQSPDAWAPLSIGCALVVLISATSCISSGQLNPAITVALGLVSKDKPFPQMITFPFMQIFAGVLAGISYCVLLGDSFKLGPPGSFKLGPKGGFGWRHVGLMETLYTFMVCFVALNVVRPGELICQYHGLAIGFAVVAGVYAAGPVSGGCLNPAVSFGIDISSVGSAWGALVYLVFQALGTLLAVVAYLVVRPPKWDQVLGNGIVRSEAHPLTLWRKLVSEFLGTFMLSLTVTLCILTQSPAAAPAAGPATSLAAGAAVMSMVYALSDVSGAHFNPAVTLAMAMRGCCDWMDAALYVLVQVIAAMSAAFVATGTHHGRLLGPMKPNTPWGAIAIAEVVFTAVVVLVAVMVSGDKAGSTARNDTFGLAAGMSYVMGGFAVGKASGGPLNPALAVALGVRATDHFWLCLPYVGFELLGALLGAALVAGMSVQDKQRGVEETALMGQTHP